jgi:hypothetical protein
VLLQDIWQGADTGVQAVGHGSGLWLVGSEHGQLAVSSDDALTFTALGAPSGWQAGNAVEDIAYHDGQFVVVGDAGQISVTRSPRTAQSWTTHTPTTADLKQVLHADGVWVTVGVNGTCLYSDDDASSWNSCNVSATGAYFYGLHHSAGQWVIGEASVPGQVILATSHRTGWTAHSLSGTGITSQGLLSVYSDCSSSRLLAAGGTFGGTDPKKRRGFIAASDDGGRTWTIQVDCAERIFDIAGD